MKKKYQKILKKLSRYHYLKKFIRFMIQQINTDSLVLEFMHKELNMYQKIKKKQ